MAIAPRQGSVCTLALVALVVLCAPGGAQAAEPPALVADGAVNAVVADGHRAYAGGDFNYIGPATGPGQVLDGGDGSLVESPRFDGPVLAVAADGAGGWFAGGGFTRVGGVKRASLAHVLADGSVDPNWAPAVVGVVLTLAVSSDTLYVGGNFSSVAGRSRNRLAAVDAVTGEVISGFDPDVGFNGAALAPAPLAALPSPPLVEAPSPERQAADLDIAEDCFDQTVENFFIDTQLSGVEAIAVDGERVYVGGAFTSIGGFERQHLAALDPRTGQVDESFDPDAATPGRNPRALTPRAETNGTVKALLVVGDRLYVGGEFTSAVGRSRSRLAAFDTAHGELVSGFDSAADGTVQALAAAGDQLFVGGSFRTIGGAARPHIAALDRVTSTPRKAFDPDVDGAVTSIAVAPDRLYVAGRFQHVGDSERPRLAAVALDNGALVERFEANADSRVTAVAMGAGRVFAGGFFVSIGGLVRHGIAALDTRPTSPQRLRGQPDSFAPPLDISVRSLLLTRDRLYASGYTGHGARIVSLDPFSGEPDADFHPPEGAPSRLVAEGNRLYAGGQEGVLNERRAALAAINRHTGRPIRDFDADVRGSVGGLALAPEGLFVGGQVYSAREDRRATKQLRPRRSAGLIEVRRDGTRASRFRPLARRFETVVHALLAENGRLYAAGFFRPRGRDHPTRLAAFDPQSGAQVRGFDAPALGGSALAMDAGSLFVNRAGSRRSGVARLNARTGARAKGFRGRVDGSVCAIAAAEGALTVGGGFVSLNGQPYENLAVLPIE